MTAPDFKQPPRYRATLEEGAWFRTWFRDHTCWVCGGPWQELHHILARSHGGDDDIDNLAPLCSPCHRKVEARDMWARRQIRWAMWVNHHAYLQRKLGGGGREAFLERNYPLEVAA